MRASIASRVPELLVRRWRSRTVAKAEHVLGLHLDSLGELVQDVTRLAEPAPLDAGFWPYFGAGSLKAHGPVAQGEGGSLLKTAGAQIYEEIPPGLGTFPLKPLHSEPV